MQNKIAKHFKKISPLTQALLIFFIFNLLLNFSLIRYGTVLQDTWKFMKFSQQLGIDSWGVMFKALEYLQSHHEIPIYSQLFFKDGVKFQYPLTSLLPIWLLDKFTTHLPTQIYFLNTLSWGAILTTSIFVVRIFNLNLHNFFPKLLSDKFRFDAFVKNLLLLLLCVMFYPLMKAHSLGQTQVFINCFFTLSVWFWLKGQEQVSGIFIGLMLLIKPQYLLIAIWGVVRKRYSFVISLFSVFILGLLCSILIFGISNNLDYLNVLKFISRTGEGYFPNQSMNGLLNRFLFNGNNLQWEPNIFAPFNPIVYSGTLLSSALLILGAFSFVRANLRGCVVDFMIITLSCTIASPVAWEHHYGILLVIFAFLLPYFLIGQPAFGKIAIVFFVFSYTLASNFLGIFNRLSSFPVLNIMQSYLFLAALSILVFLYAVGEAECRPDNLQIRS